MLTDYCIYGDQCRRFSYRRLLERGIYIYSFCRKANSHNNSVQEHRCCVKMGFSWDGNKINQIEDVRIKLKKASKIYYPGDTVIGLMEMNSKTAFQSKSVLPMIS